MILCLLPCWWMSIFLVIVNISSSDSDVFRSIIGMEYDFINIEANEYCIEFKKILMESHSRHQISMFMYPATVLWHNSRVNYYRSFCLLYSGYSSLALKTALIALHNQPVQKYTLELYICCAIASLVHHDFIRSYFYVELVKSFGYSKEDISRIFSIRLDNSTYSFPNAKQMDTSDRLDAATVLLMRQMNGQHSLFSLQNTQQNEFGIIHSGSLETGYEPFLRRLEFAYNITGLTPLKSTLICNPMYFPESMPTIRWPSQLPVKVYFCADSSSTVFAENSVGLSNLLDRLGIPNKIVTKIAPHDPSLYIITFLCAEKIIEPAFKILWNFEKNPLISTDELPSGFMKDKKGITRSVYSYGHVVSSRFIWESSATQVYQWRSVLLDRGLPQKVAFIPPLEPDRVIKKNCEIIRETIMTGNVSVGVMAIYLLYLPIHLS